MPGTSIHAAIDPEMKDKARDLAERQDITLSEYARRAIERKASRDEREWDRVEREISKLGQKSDRDLENREQALLDRLDDLSPAEEHLLDAIQEELRERVTDPMEVAKTA